LKKKFRFSSLQLIKKCEGILNHYHSMGYDMTLRQLYYQLVAADEIPNKKESYDNLGSLVNDARLAGYLDWNMLVDRTRGLRGLSHWDMPADVVKSAAYSFAVDKWKYQAYRPEIWIEKEALAGVFERVATELDVPFFSCKGYNSQSEMWRAAMRFSSYRKDGKIPIVFHFGDHDPSGIDMTRDIDDRIKMFMGGVPVERLALNMNQVEEFNPPPNPAKITDSRAKVYIQEYGDESWELDALDPDTLAGLIRDAILRIRDEKAWQAAVDEENDGQNKLHIMADHYGKVEEFIIDEGLERESHSTSIDDDESEAEYADDDENFDEDDGDGTE
jgi:hypothetical protein